MIFLSFE
jgi:hypothetical protein